MSEPQVEPQVPDEEPLQGPLSPDEGDATEEPDEDEDAPQAPDEEQPAPPPSEDEIEAVNKKLEGLQKHVAKRLGEILGDDAATVVACELCTWGKMPGYRWPMQPPAEVLSQLFMLLGQKDPAEIKHDPHSQTCAECAGEGVTATGSKVQGQTELPCVNCDGRGWTPTDDARRVQQSGFTNGVQPTPLAPLAETPAAPGLSPELQAHAEALRKAGAVVIPPMQVA